MKIKTSSILSLSIIIAVAITACKKNKTDATVEPPKEKKLVVTTVAGSDSTAGYVNGPALSAKFGHPFDVAVTNEGAIYVTDLDNRRIRKIVNGQVSTFAGSGNRGIINGDGLASQFMSPFHIAVDLNGNLYTSDADDARIRKISPAAEVSTFAGTNMLGFKDGKADTAQFDFDDDMIADSGGNIFVADPWNNRIRRISTSGDVTTIAGGFDSNTPFHFPGAITMDAQGNLYVADVLRNVIRKITPAGQVSKFAGSGVQGFADGDSSAAQFYDLYDMVIDSKGNLYVGDNHRIRKISPQGIVSTLAGDITPGYSDGDLSSAKFNYPRGLAIDAHDNIFVADTYNHRIRKIGFE